MKRREFSAWAAAHLLGAATAARADGIVTLVVPYPPGGTSDTLGRILAQELGTRLGETLIVRNRPGGGTIVAAGEVARAAPDGNTLFFSSNTTFTVNPALRSTLPYDVLRSFESVGTVGITPLVLAANTGVPARTVQDVVAFSHAAPGGAAFGSFGAATTSHLAGEAFNFRTGARLRHVPYASGVAAIKDMIGGEIPFAFVTPLDVMPSVRAGTVRAIAVTSAQHSELVPQVPSIAESGFAGYEVMIWAAMVVPHGVPAARRSALTAALESTLSDPGVRARFAALAFDARYAPPADYERRIAQELPVLRDYARKAGIRPE
jgi:tripartite-type tricarboxylate transporter receptor subunit TctC